VTTLLNHIEFLPADVVVPKTTPKAAASARVQPSGIAQPG
jgi:hypothetical protein